ncbi:MAG: hypothetical protein WKF43_02920 [Acidimicrobiales bacterium]
MGPVEVIVVLVALVVTILIGYWIGTGIPRRQEREVREWASAHALELTSGNGAFVRQYLRTGHRLRVRCMIGGFILAATAQARLWPEQSVDLSFVGLLIGYLVGTLWAEVSLTRSRAGPARSAALVPRSLEDYLPGRLRLSLRIVGPVTAGAWLATRHLAYPAQEVDLPREPLGLVLGAMGLSLIAPIDIEATQRWVLSRPQPLVATDLVAADDAVRSASLHFLGGSGVAIVLISLTAAAARLADTDVQFLRWTMPWIAFVSFFTALVFWRYYSHRAWRVQRRLPSTVVPTPS